MQDWIEVDIADHETARKAIIRGVEVELFVSPYDVPDGVRGRFDATGKKFEIDFKYIGSESTTRNVEYEHVVYKIGESSGRLYGLSIDVQTLGADGVGVSVELHDNSGQELAARIRDKVTGAIDYLIERHPIGNSREDNYKLAKDAILLTSPSELFAVAA